jgi:hypothetical protein
VDVLAPVVSGVSAGQRVTNDTLFSALGIEAKDRNGGQVSRLGAVMKELGFERAVKPFRVSGTRTPQRGFVRVR